MLINDTSLINKFDENHTMLINDTSLINKFDENHTMLINDMSLINNTTNDTMLTNDKC
jgi:hypothetical protein